MRNKEMKNKLEVIRKDIADALKSVAVKHNMVFEMGRTRYNDMGFKTSLEGSLADENGNSLKKEADWNQAVSIGYVKADWLNRSYDKDQYIIIGVDLSKKKNIIVIKKKSNDKIYITSTMTVKRIIARDSLCN